MKYGKKDYKLLTKGGTVLSKIPGTIGGNKKLKIYGKFDCKCALNWIKKGYYIDNRVFFEDEETAKEIGYRPCGVCMKKEYKIWKENSKK
ncbi:MAG: metal-binding protein [Bacilli bacterium]|nr:metal-binding protein [Bacilli bacterium]